MTDRKYRQRGYQDDPRREPKRDQKPAEKKEYAPRGQPPMAPKTFNMPGFREVVRCARCGHELTAAAAWSADGNCIRCGADMHTCAQCLHFDTGAPFECQKPVPTRVSPKDARNSCPALRAADDGRARNQVGGADERPQGLRRSLQ